MIEIAAIIPCYNCADTVKQAVYSVINQTVKVSQIILVDDCSTDQTMHELLSLSSQFPNVEVHQTLLNSGAGAARNLGLQYTPRNIYVAFLDADDVWHPRKVEHTIAVFNDGHKWDMVCHLICPIDQTKMQNTADLPYMQPHLVSSLELLFWNPIPLSSIVFKNEGYSFFAARYAEDYDFLIRYALDRKRIGIVRYPLGFNLKRGLSLNKICMDQGVLRTYQRLAKLGYISKFKCVILMALFKCRRTLQKLLSYAKN